MIYYILGVMSGFVIAAVAAWLFDRDGSESRDKDLSWQDGFASGHSDEHSDWTFALDDVIPESIDIAPMAVRRYITTLQEEAARGSH